MEQVIVNPHAGWSKIEVNEPDPLWTLWFWGSFLLTAFVASLLLPKSLPQ